MDSSLNTVSSVEDWGDDSDEVQLVHQQTYRIRLYATSLPVKGMFRGRACDSFAVVSSTESTERVQHQHMQGHHSRDNSSSSYNMDICSAHMPPQPSHTRNSSITSTRSSFGTSSIWGQTEVVYKTPNPHWTKTIGFNYQTGSNTFFYVHLFQHTPGPKEPLQSLGTALFNVPDLLSTKNCTRVKRLRNGGCVFCRLEAVRDYSNMNRTVRLKLQALQLVLPGGKAATLLRRSAPDTVLEIARHDTSTGLWLVICRTAPVQESLDPVYDRVEVDLESLCGGNLDCPLRLQVMLVHRGTGEGSGRDDPKRRLIGLSETTLRQMMKNATIPASTGMEQSSTALEECSDSLDGDDDGANVDEGVKQDPRMLLRLQRSSTKLKDVGRLCVLHASIRSEDEMALENGTVDNSTNTEDVVEIVDLSTLTPLSSSVAAATAVAEATSTRSFSSYVEDGCQIDFCVAIDFTSSNGDPRQKDSYHYLSDNTLNDYEETISAIGQALQKYSQTQEYSVYGFGAKFGDQVRHIFQCGPKPTVHGVDGILQAYKSVFESDLIMSGPTVFHQVLQAAAVRAKHHHDIMRQTPCYTVLLVITDGTIAPSDFHDTRRRLDAYSTMPLSVVFVGVGRSDFHDMYHLCRVSQPGIRRNTTFVEFRRHQHNPTALGEAALRNVPTQLCEYMRLHDI